MISKSQAKRLRKYIREYAKCESNLDIVNACGWGIKVGMAEEAAEKAEEAMKKYIIHLTEPTLPKICF